MYRILIVDDERIARESVYGLLATQEDLELELLTAESAVKAVSILETEQIDITIMDINMPQMTGLELYQVVREKWPQCKVIFLTGYSEFDYVYQVHKHARYVLKGDREEVLLEAVRESIREIENEMIIARASEVDPTFKQRAGVSRANEFMNELIDGFTNADDVNNEVLRDMNILIDCRQPVYSMMVRCEGLRDASFAKRQTIAEKSYRLLERYFVKDSRTVIAGYKKINFFLLLQPERRMPEDAQVRRLQGLCSLFQNALQANAEVDAAILIYGGEQDFKTAIRTFGRLYDGLLRIESGDTQVMPRQSEETVESAIWEEDRTRILRSILKLEMDFETANLDEILHMIRRIRAHTRGAANMYDLFFVEVYQRISTVLLRTVKQQKLKEEQIFQMGMMDLYNTSAYHNWEQAFTRLEETAENVIRLQHKNKSVQEGDLVTRIKNYIQENLQEGPSLTAIADHFHFSREYLLRVFKKEEGVTILQYINDTKMNEAMRMLQTSELAIKEIAEILGFSSSAYFIRFFRTKTGKSPNEFRKRRNID